jgi:hypothetical protein
MQCGLPYEEWFLGSVIPGRQCCEEQRAYMHQLGEKEQPVALIRKEYKQCYQQQL